MRKLLAIIVLLFLALPALAAVRWAPRTYSGDTVISTASTQIIDASIYYKGVTAGDSIIFYNTNTAAATASPVYVFYAPAANGVTPITNIEGFTCDTGIYMDSTVTGAGVMGVSILYQ